MVFFPFIGVLGQMIEFDLNVSIPILLDLNMSFDVSMHCPKIQQMMEDGGMWYY